MGKRPSCVFGFFKNEDELVHTWCKHYKKHFDRRDIYAFDNNSDDATSRLLEEENINVERVTDDFKSLNEYVVAVKKKYDELLARHDSVLFAESDDLNESPEQGLAKYIETFLSSTDTYRHHTCYEPVHLIDTERQIDLNEPLLAQRTTWVRHYKFDSAVLVKKHVSWQRGWHYVNDEQVPDNDFVLVHLKWIDFDLMNRRNKKRNTMCSNFEHSCDDELRKQFKLAVTEPNTLFGKSEVSLIPEELKKLV